MQAAIFDDTIDKFSPILKEGKIYYIKGGYAKINDKKYTNIKTDYKLIFDFNTQIIEVDKNLDKIFDKTEEKIIITKFVDLSNCKVNQVINCLGYVLQIFPVTIKQSRIGNVLIRRVILCDSSMFKVQFTLWNKFTELDLNQGNIVLLKYIRVGNFNNNINISTVDNSIIEINPDLSNEGYTEYDELVKAIHEGINEEDIKFINEYNITNSSLNVDSIKSLANNNIIFISDLIKQLRNKFNNRLNDTNNNINETHKEISMNFTIKATVLEFEHSDKNYYFACPYCRKKLVQNEEKYSCPNCENQINDPKLNYFLTLRVIDISGEHALNFFGDQVNNLFGLDAKSYSNLIENKEYKKLEKITNNVEYHCFYFNGKANIIQYGTRLKTQLFVHNFEQEDFKKEKKRIFKDIKDVLNIKE
jgi:replication factor A1